MTNEKKNLYSRAYVELYELIKNLTEQEKNKIPEKVINSIINKMDKNYKFEIDKSKGLLEQDYSVETKALIIKVYEKYLAPEEEKNFWNKYNWLCNKKIEESKKEKYNINVFQSNDINKNIINNKNEELQIIEYQRMSFINLIKEKIKKILKSFLHKIKNK